MCTGSGGDGLCQKKLLNTLDHLLSGCRHSLMKKGFLGCRYTEEERLAHKFDDISMGYDCSGGLSPELVNAFIKYQPNWQATTQKRHISFLQNFGSYLLNHDIQAFLPGYDTLRAAVVNLRPYIFSHEEINGLFHLSDQIHPNYRKSHIFYPVLFRVLYGTGMRISEALHLKMDDVDLEEEIIRVVDPKNHKDRHLPISSSLAEYCSWYRSKIHPIYHGDDLFFLSNKGDGHYSRNNIQVYFNTLICRMGIPYNGYKGGGPHLHCLRHTFCVHSLVKMLKENVPQGECSSRSGIPTIECVYGAPFSFCHWQIPAADSRGISQSDGKARKHVRRYLSKI